jgi:predicted RNA-binding Zn-ribbon protein involved in translation (DUF1610 family)
MSILTDAELVFLDNLVRRPDAVPQYGPGRVCSKQGCGTILSVYNSAEMCAAHGGKPIWAEDEPADQKRCSGCGNVLALDQFRRDSSRRDGRTYRCKDCLKLRDRGLYQRPERRASLFENQRKRRERANTKKTVTAVFPNHVCEMELK